MTHEERYPPPYGTDALAEFRRTQEGDFNPQLTSECGNLLIVGSIANIITVDAARRRGVAIDWRRHARTGIPVTVATLAITAAWFYFAT